MTGERYGRSFWAGLAIGSAIAGFGVLSLFDRAGATRPAAFAVYVLAGVLAHDLVLTPVVLAVGRLVRARVPARTRGPIQAGLFVTGVITLASVPVVVGFGRIVSNDSLLPRDGAFGLLLVLAGVWSAAGLAAWGSRRRTRRRVR